MKKLLLIALAINFVACSDDSIDDIENTSNAIPAAKTYIFNPDPTPEDYLAAKHPSFMENLAELSNINNSFKRKTAERISTYVPDAAFRAKLISLGAAEDPDPTDNYVTIDNTRGGLNLSGAGISDLTGINSFTSLFQLVVSGNNLTTLDVSGLTNLGWLNCSYNQLTTLDLSANTKLQQIWCHKNKLTNLTIPSSPRLWGLWCYGNKLTTLERNGNRNITHLFIQQNRLEIFEFEYLTKLKLTNVSINGWRNLNLRRNRSLTRLWCYFNNRLTFIDLKNGHNTILVDPEFRNNAPNLKIRVDDIIYSYGNWKKIGSARFIR